MIKLVGFLRKQRFLVFIFFALPFLGLIFGDRLELKVLPEREFPTFNVLFVSPGVQAGENLSRVTEVAERVFNGAPGLLHLESTTRDEQVSLHLIFQKRLSRDQARLYLQERIDRLKLELPRDVTRVEVSAVEYDEPSSVSVVFSKSIAASDLKVLMSQWSDSIANSVPDIRESLHVRIVPDPNALLREKVSLSQLVQALKVSGVLASIGENSGVIYQLGVHFRSLEELRAILVGSRGHRPISLQQVARVEAVPLPPVRELAVWFDAKNVDRKAMIKDLLALDPSAKIKSGATERMRKVVLLPLIGFVCLLIFQVIFARIVFGGWAMLTLLLIFDVLLGSHFLFWLSVMRGSVTLPDLTAWLLSISIGTVFFLILFARIRTFFMPKKNLPKSIESTEQAALVGLAELLPTFLCLSFALYFLSQALIGTDVNIPSRLVLTSFFTYGLPNVFLLLLFVPAVIDNRLIGSAIAAPEMSLNWTLRRAQVRNWALACWLLAFLAPVLFYFMPIGVAPYRVSEAHDELKVLLEEARGHGSSFVFLDSRQNQSGEKPAGTSTFKANRFADYRVMQFSPVGLGQLPDLDVLGFQQAIRSFASRETIGYLTSQKQEFAVKLAPDLLKNDNLGDLSIAGKRSAVSEKSLRILVDSSFEKLPAEIYRNRMLTADWLTLDAKVSLGNLKAKVPAGLVPTQWTSYLQNQMEEFNWQHVSIGAFLYLLLALYMNSFVRAATLVGLLGLPYATICGLRLALPGVAHADSLWLLAFMPWLSLVVLLVLSRISDVERIRGHDRDLVLDDSRSQFAPSVLISVLFFPATTATLGLLSLLHVTPDPGFWQEGLIVGILGALITWLSTKVLFPLFYLESEETVERFLIRIALRLQRLRRKLRRRIAS